VRRRQTQEGEIFRINLFTHNPHSQQPGYLLYPLTHTYRWALATLCRQSFNVLLFSLTWSIRRVMLTSRLVVTLLRWRRRRRDTLLIINQFLTEIGPWIISGIHLLDYHTITAIIPGRMEMNEAAFRVVSFCPSGALLYKWCGQVFDTQHRWYRCLNIGMSHMCSSSCKCHVNWVSTPSWNPSQMNSQRREGKRIN
jgi:hypothetical protein